MQTGPGRNSHQPVTWHLAGSSHCSGLALRQSSSLSQHHKGSDGADGMLATPVDRVTQHLHKFRLRSQLTLRYSQDLELLCWSERAWVRYLAPALSLRDPKLFIECVWASVLHVCKMGIVVSTHNSETVTGNVTVPSGTSMTPGVPSSLLP